jgi:hypothetical protein
MAARNKDVRREWVVFGFHCRKLGLNVTGRRSEGVPVHPEDVPRA